MIWFRRYHRAAEIRIRSYTGTRSEVKELAAILQSTLTHVAQHHRDTEDKIITKRAAG